jgi:hypothetical protein
MRPCNLLSVCRQIHSTADVRLLAFPSRRAARGVNTRKLLTSFIVTVAIGSFLFSLQPKVMRNAEMSVVAPGEISTLLVAAIQPTEKWWFRGGTGRYLRAMTLPSMGKTTRSRSSTKELHVQLIDPTELAVCNEYAVYRSGLRSATKNDGRRNAYVKRYTQRCSPYS